MTQAREGAVAAAGGDLVAERYEVAVDERICVPVPSAVVRMVGVQIESTRVEEGLAFIRAEMSDVCGPAAGSTAPRC